MISRGQSLIEVIVSMGIAVLLAVALITTSLITQKGSRSARNNLQATKLVQQYIEQIKVFREKQGFSSLINGCGKLNTADPDPKNWVWDHEVCPGGTITDPLTLDKTEFTRKLEISTYTTNTKLITVTVTWNESNGLQTVQNKTYLSKW